MSIMYNGYLIAVG